MESAGYVGHLLLFLFWIGLSLPPAIQCGLDARQDGGRFMPWALRAFVLNLVLFLIACGIIALLRGPPPAFLDGRAVWAHFCKGQFFVVFCFCALAIPWFVTRTLVGWRFASRMQPD